MSRQAAYQERRDRNSTTFDNTYQTLGIAITSKGLIVKITNDSNVDIDLSTDGVTDHDFIPAGSFTLLDLRANHGREDEFAFEIGTQFYVKGSAPGTGSVYLTMICEAV